VSGPASASVPLRVALHGAGGRMGGALCRLLADSADLRLVAAWGRAGDPRLGRDLGTIHGLGSLGVSLVASGGAGPTPDVVVDFSRPEALSALVDLCRERRLPLVSGTTGGGDPERILARAAEVVPVVWAPNFSPALAALEAVLPDLVASLPEADFAVLDVHHRAKRDRPSGTAEGLARLLGGDLRSVSIASLRIGDVVGDHALYIAGADERLEIWHRVRDRAVFARGALLAARRLVVRPPGLHRFADVLRAQER
jgi:4-hydroxy-tetrahydrodipicolinate reductase